MAFLSLSKHTKYLVFLTLLGSYTQLFAYLSPSCLSEPEFRVIERSFIDRIYPNDQDWAEVSFVRQRDGSYKSFWKDSSNESRRYSMEKAVPVLVPLGTCRAAVIKYKVHFRVHGDPQKVKLIRMSPRGNNIYEVSFEPLI